jgi:acetolactate synthase-1/3 small subunit
MQEIALYKVSRGKSVERIIREHSVRILEVGDDYMVLERTGHTEDTQALLKLLQPFGVQQFVRSGLVAVIKAENEGVSNYLAERLRQKLAEEAAEAQKNNSN